jgi:mono/diheme cytochrome c family protein
MCRIVWLHPSPLGKAIGVPTRKRRDSSPDRRGQRTRAATRWAARRALQRQWIATGRIAPMGSAWHDARAMRITLAFALACSSLLVACGDGRPRAPVSDGERLYQARCTACHAAYEPASRTPDEWRAAVSKMERWRKVRLNDSERALILAYVTGTEPRLPAPPTDAVAR